MSLTELFNTIFLILGLLTAIWVFNVILRKVVAGPLSRVLFSLSVFILISILILLLPYWLGYSDDPNTSYSVKWVLECFWWFSINFLANQLLNYFLWNKFLLYRGIVVSKLIRDLVALSILIVTVACVVYFVFNRSVVGIFAASGVMAIILGYSAQATLSDVFAGLGLNITKQFSEGDLIRVFGLGDVVGKVQDINWRFVNFLTLEGNNLSIPNSVVAKQPIANLSPPSLTRGIEILIPMPDNISPDKVKNILVSAAKQSFKVAKDHEPVASLLQMKGAENTFQLAYYTREPDENIVSDEIQSIIWYQLRRQGVKQSEGFDLRPLDRIKESLKKTDLFAFLNDEELGVLAENCGYHEYGPPERILEQGQKNESLFIIVKGLVEVFITTPTNQTVSVATLTTGQYFGEMSLLTGDPVSATIIFKSESIIIEISHDNISPLFSKRAELIDKMSEAVVLRKLHNESVRSSLSHQDKKEQNTLISRMAQRVRSFFKKKKGIEE